MSGPKTYAARLEAALSEIINLQAQVQIRFAELSRMRMEDKHRAITIDCGDDIRALQERVDQALEVYSASARLIKTEQTTMREIKNKKKELEALIGLIGKAGTNFSYKQEDYETYVGYEQSVNAFNKAFNDRKTAAKQVIEKYSPAAQPEMTRQTMDAVDQVRVDEPVPAFELNFRKKKKQLNAQLQDKISKAEDTIAKIISNLIPPSAEKPSLARLKKGSAGLEKRIQQINNLIADADNPHLAYLYKQRLVKLQNSETFREEYFYIELLEDIRQTEQTIRMKQDIRKILCRLNIAAIHPSFAQTQRELIAAALELIDRTQIRENEFQDFEFQAGQLLKQNEKLVSRELVKEKERQYIKAQIIESLRVRRFEVVEESEVIDFEKESDFLMQIPGQPNYLNIRFNEDGTFLYNFLIPEDKNNLGIGQKQQKLNEMTSTCADFRTMLGELAAAGLNVSLTKEKEVSESALIQIPAKLKSRLDSSDQRKSKKTQLKERTLKR